MSMLSSARRDDPSARGISRLERVNLKLTARNAARAHDAGAIVEPEDDISQRYRVSVFAPSSGFPVGV